MVTLRRTKGAPLTHEEMDANFDELQNKVSSANPVTSGVWTHTGNRPVVMSASAGTCSIRGDAGGWALEHGFSGGGGTPRGGFGALGAGDGLTYYYIGADYAAPHLRLSNSDISVCRPIPFGYGPGSGGTVIQPTSKSTAVAIHKPSGRITLSSEALAAGAAAGFTVINSFVDANTIIVPSIVGGVTSPINYQVVAGLPFAGGFGLYVKNQSAGALSEAVVIQFDIFKGAAS